MNAPVKVPTHIVVEVFERDMGAKKLCYSEEEAIDAANEMLKEHLKLMGYSGNTCGVNKPGECEPTDIEDDEYDECDEDDEDDDFDYACASKSNSNAWCNYDDEHWDAYIIELKED